MGEVYYNKLDNNCPFVIQGQSPGFIPGTGQVCQLGAGTIRVNPPHDPIALQVGEEVGAAHSMIDDWLVSKVPAFLD